MSIVNSSLVYNRSIDGANISIYETKAVVKGCSSVVDCICVRTQESRVHNCVIPLSNSVPMSVVNRVHDFASRCGIAENWNILICISLNKNRAHCLNTSF